MKVFYNLQRCVGFLVLFSILLAACVNHISEEEEAGVVVNDGNIPLKIIADIHEVANTRVANNTFEKGDEVGLFALAGSTTIQEERYADNLHFVRSADGEFIADESVYYPDDGVTLNLISYYPYREEGVAMGESKMPVSIETEQNIPANYSHSDFLVATKEDVLATQEAIALTYNHKFFRLKIALVSGEGEDVESMLTANPKLSVSGFYTKSIYDFQKKSYSSFTDEKDIIPTGEWEIVDERLVGKDLILIPQEATVGYQYITLEANGKPYTCLLPSTLKLQDVTLEVEGKQYISLLPSTLNLQEGKQRELEITFVAAEDILMSKLNGEINDWEGTEVDHTGSETLHKYIDVSKLTFENSNICKVLNKGKQMAEICKEYLVTPDFSSQAIVVYPMKEDGTADLSRGLVAQLLGKTGKVHGGNVVWDTENHSLNYTPGTLPARNNIYVMANGEVSLSVAMGDDVLQVLALEDVARDVRGGMIHNYPLVKIGTQYWMRDNLKASFYIDGNEIPKLDAVTDGAVGYLQSEANATYYFYTASVALSGNILPNHWSVPTWEDWNILKTYLKEDASLLKSGTWLPLNTGDTAEPATNWSGFDGIPVGMYVGTFQLNYEGKYLAYWTLDETNSEIAETVFYLKSDTNLIESSKAGTDKKALAIRCIRK